MNSSDRSDPPMEPFEGSITWIETGPEPILDDLDAAVLMTRVGMAINAMSSQVHFGQIVSAHPASALKTRNLLASLITVAAYTNEAIQLAKSGMRQLRPFAVRGNADDRLLGDVGQLLAGNHPAETILKRARNNLGFHWDDDTRKPDAAINVIRRSLKEYGKNQKLIWVEMNSDGDGVYRLAFDVVAHALLFEVTGAGGVNADNRRAVADALEVVRDAHQLLRRFFMAAVAGYLLSCGAKRAE